MSLTVELITPEGPVFEGSAQAVQVPGREGSFEVLQDHAALLSMLGQGRVRITDEQGTQSFYQIDGGVVEVLNNQVMVLAERVMQQHDN